MRAELVSGDDLFGCALLIRDITAACHFFERLFTGIDIPVVGSGHSAEISASQASGVKEPLLRFAF